MARTSPTPHRAPQPLWYKDAVIYELHVRAFSDSNADGVGDFPGLTQKLDYLQNLGVTALWLLPFYPSPGKDDGYDIADYTDVNPQYGTLQDFKTFMREAHRRGLRVITELVLNHTSDQHPWFQRARKAPAGSRWREFYVWSHTPDRYREARIIFKDFERSNWAWDEVAGAYYWHRFYTHQPDLNFDSPLVRAAMLKVVDFWLRMGVDGLRLDAVPYLFEREGTNGENLPETHAFLKELRLHVDQQFRDRLLLAEANQWPEDAASYFGDGDEVNMAFHFPLMPRLFMAISQEDRFPIVDVMQLTPPVPETAQWALFLRNHDELTLEMVTDEDRDYMYKAYAQEPSARINLGIRRRLAPLLQNDRRAVELMKSLLFSLPGTPVLYYGDEIGMGDNIFLGDRNGVRTPMQWSPDRNAGFSGANPQQLYLPVIIDPLYHYQTINVETQQRNRESLLWWMKRIIALRTHNSTFGRGELEFLFPDNRKVLAFIRTLGEESIVVVANLSRTAQSVELNLDRFAGRPLFEMFGSNEFPPIQSGRSYPLSVGPRGFYWLLIPAGHTDEPAGERVPEPLQVDESWDKLLDDPASLQLAVPLAQYLTRQRWFQGKSRVITGVRVLDAGRVRDQVTAYLTLLRVEYTEGESDTYLLPVAYMPQDRETTEEGQAAIRAMSPIVQLQISGPTPSRGMLYDATASAAFSRALVRAIGKRRRIKGRAGSFVFRPSRSFVRLADGEATLTAPRLSTAEQTNSSIVYGDRVILKLYRRLEDGVNPDLELVQFLTEETGFAHVPPMVGSITYQGGTGETTAVGLLQGFVPNEGDAWYYTLDVLEDFFQRALTGGVELPGGDSCSLPLLELAVRPIDSAVSLAIGPYLSSVHLLGVRTGELHLALAGGRETAFVPEPFTGYYQRSLYHSARAETRRALALLRRAMPRLHGKASENARAAVALEESLLGELAPLLKTTFDGARTRVHGDYHLGQVLFTGRDFQIIDLEGEPSRPLTQRRMKRTPLTDVASMVRSFHYAAYAALSHGQLREEDRDELEPWARMWYRWVSAAFLSAYLETVGGSGLLPTAPEQRGLLLKVCLLQKTMYELRYELDNRPEWVAIPLEGVMELFREGREDC